MAKLYASQVAQKAAGAAIEWAGGVGFTRETGIEKYWRDSKIGAIYEGTSNIQIEVRHASSGLADSRRRSPSSSARRACPLCGPH